ncbi:helix-turn-helix domain-containing protein [bacterium]|nr:MAG: helix-turn-helix domain-containing protein [bacterium]
METKPLPNHHAQFQRVLEYIDLHLDEDLSLELLSEVAATSKFHFHRQFSAFFGLSLHRYIKLLRFKRAAYRLAYRPNDSILNIALDSGYESPEAFARAFKERTSQTPSAFRQQPDWNWWDQAQSEIHRLRNQFMTTDFQPDQVRIIDFPATQVAVLEHHGDPRQLGETIRRFIAWRKSEGLSPKVSATFNILHNDPENVAPEEYRLDLCVTTSRAITPNEYRIKSGQIEGGRCAVLRLQGSSDNLRPAVSFLYSDWLPNSGEELRDFPVFVQRVSFFPDVLEHEAITDIFLPLR